ncbi:MAG: nucleotidyltransferase domain-containing protein [Cytophagales bacterium]|nr:nucleotidyltransferase domain-containing protein [Cytophagales bacterium]
MLTRKAVNDIIHAFLADLAQEGYTPERAVLFGSYAYGKPKETSDIDLALWDEHFIGCLPMDVPPIVHVQSRHRPLEVHTFAAGSTEDDDPFIAEILKKGIEISLLENRVSKNEIRFIRLG